ncbi:class I SAM-dependent methyltransferase [Fodinisporobacter ferrooxydans]|uniref:Class I SAM-dependent methyltransferase n=1 Tax=Fodinisporobacter ferrooxydans TaxID=2901836 RepID=A0ABY4CEI3_9BACL|nr:class I SAM-dependent methyltransferase [Alicyclobacillaceae bacterium MYW30-H2]
MTVPISKRLQTVASLIPGKSVVADIGSDHAYLPVFLVQSGKIDQAIAGEVHEGPYQSALRTVLEYQLQNHITVRKGDGLEVIQPQEVETIVIAGMGGGTILEIIRAGLPKLMGVKRFVLQPMNHADRLREFLIQHNWEVADEELVLEDGILYEIIAAEPSPKPQTWENWQYAVGLRLFEKRHPLLAEKAKLELLRIDRALEGLARSHAPDTDKLEQFEMLKKKWLEVLDAYGESR